MMHHEKDFLLGSGNAEAVTIVSMNVRQQVGRGRRLRLL